MYLYRNLHLYEKMFYKIIEAKILFLIAFIYLITLLYLFFIFINAKKKYVKTYFFVYSKLFKFLFPIESFLKLSKYYY